MPEPTENPQPQSPEQPPTIQALRKEIESLVSAINAGTGATTTVNLVAVRNAFMAAQTSLGARYESLMKQVLEAVRQIQGLQTPPAVIPDTLVIPNIARQPLAQGLTKAIASLNAPLPTEREQKVKEEIAKVQKSLSALRAKIEADRKTQNLSPEEAAKKTLDEATKKQIDTIVAMIHGAPTDIRQEAEWKTFEESAMKSLTTMRTQFVTQAQQELQKNFPDMPSANPLSTVADNIDNRLSQLVAPTGPMAPLFKLIREKTGMAPENVASMILNAVRGFFADFLTNIKLPSESLRGIQDNLRQQGVALKWRILLKQELERRRIVMTVGTAGLAGPLAAAGTLVATQQIGTEPSTEAMMQRLGLNDDVRTRYMDCYLQFLEAKDGGNRTARPPTLANVQNDEAAVKYRATLTGSSTPTNAPAETVTIGSLPIPAAGLDVGTSESKITHDSKEVRFIKSNTNENEYSVSFGTAPNVRTVKFKVGTGNVTSLKLLRPESGTATGDVRVQLNGQTAVKLSQVVSTMEGDTQTPRRTHLKIENGNLSLESANPAAPELPETEPTNATELTFGGDSIADIVTSQPKKAVINGKNVYFRKNGSEIQMLVAKDGRGRWATIQSAANTNATRLRILRHTDNSLRMILNEGRPSEDYTNAGYIVDHIVRRNHADDRLNFASLES